MHLASVLLSGLAQPRKLSTYVEYNGLDYTNTITYRQPGSTSPDPAGKRPLSSAFRPPDHPSRYIMHNIGCMLVALQSHKERSSRHAPEMN